MKRLATLALSLLSMGLVVGCGSGYKAPTEGNFTPENVLVHVLRELTGKTPKKDKDYTSDKYGTGASIYYKKQYECKEDLYDFVVGKLPSYLEESGRAQEINPYQKGACVSGSYVTSDGIVSLTIISYQAVTADYNMEAGDLKLTINTFAVK